MMPRASVFCLSHDARPCRALGWERSLPLGSADGTLSYLPCGILWKSGRGESQPLDTNPRHACDYPPLGPGPKGASGRSYTSGTGAKRGIL